MQGADARAGLGGFKGRTGRLDGGDRYVLAGRE